MKKIKYILFVILLMGVSFSSYGQSYVVSTTAAVNSTYINISQDDAVQYVVQPGDTKTIPVETNLAFVASSNQAWCETEAIMVNEKRHLKLTVAANNEDDVRQAVVTLKGKDNNSVSLTVNQLGLKANIFVDKESVNVYHYDLKFSLEISSNVAFSFELPSWITTNDTPAIGFKTYNFTVDPITEEEAERNATIIIKSTGGSVADISIPVNLSHVGYPSFAVISDTHFGNSQGEGPMVKVPKALKNLTSHKKLDALFVVGDLTDWGTAPQYTQLTQVFKDKNNFTNPVDTMFFLMGNHDNYDGGAINNYKNGLKSFNNGNEYPLEQYIVIKGYPFITLSQRSGSNTDANDASIGQNSYPKAVQDSLSNWLERASRDFPGKPIFVFSHVPTKFSAYSSWPSEGDGTAWPTWSMKVLNPILNKYPQVVVFGGHSHYPIGDPRSIHQGVNPNSSRQNFFTALNTGSTTYSEIHSPSVEPGNHPERYAYVTEGMILTVQPNEDVEIRRYDTYRNVEMHPETPWVVKAPHDGTMFEFADKRDADDTNVYNRPIRNGLPAPIFANEAQVTIDSYSTNSVTVTYPQATDNDYVFRYLVKIKRLDGTVEKEYRQFSQFYLTTEMPQQLTAQINGLTQNTSYIAEVTALDSYENASEPIVSAEFKTGTYTPDPGSSKPDANTLLLDVVFNEDGSATDISSLQNAVVPGSTLPETYFNEDYNIQVAKFIGSNTSFYKVDYKNNQTIKSAFSNGFTFETLYKTNNTGNVAPMSAQEGGGAGIEQASGGQLQFYVNIGGSYKIVKSSVTVKAGQFYHVVAIYDKSGGKILMYVDGNLAGEEAVSGSFTFPGIDAAHWIGIGGDANPSGNAQFSLNGEVAVARMYNKAVTRDEVFWMYNDYDLDENTEPQEPEALVLPVDFPTSKLEGHWQFNSDGVVEKTAKQGTSLSVTNDGGVTYPTVDGLKTAFVVNSNVGSMSPNFLTLNHQLEATDSEDTEVKDYCIVMDVKTLFNTSYLPVLWSKSYSGDADIFVKNDGSIGLNGGGLGYTSAGFIQDGWNRIVINAKLSENIIEFYTVYPNGTVNTSKRKVSATARFSLRTNSASTIFQDNDGEDGDVYIAQFVLFNDTLDQEELDDILVPWTK